MSLFDGASVSISGGSFTSIKGDVYHDPSPDQGHQEPDYTYSKTNDPYNESPRRPHPDRTQSTSEVYRGDRSRPLPGPPGPPLQPYNAPPPPQSYIRPQPSQGYTRPPPLHPYTEPPPRHHYAEPPPNHHYTEPPSQYYTEPPRSHHHTGPPQQFMQQQMSTADRNVPKSDPYTMQNAHMNKSDPYYVPPIDQRAYVSPPTHQVSAEGRPVNSDARGGKKNKAHVQDRFDDNTISYSRGTPPKDQWDPRWDQRRPKEEYSSDEDEGYGDPHANRGSFGQSQSKRQVKTHSQPQSSLPQVGGGVGPGPYDGADNHYTQPTDRVRRNPQKMTRRVPSILEDKGRPKVPDDSQRNYQPYRADPPPPHDMWTKGPVGTGIANLSIHDPIPPPISRNISDPPPATYLPTHNNAPPPATRNKSYPPPPRYLPTHDNIPPPASRNKPQQPAATYIPTQDSIPPPTNDKYQIQTPNYLSTRDNIPPTTSRSNHRPPSAIYPPPNDSIPPPKSRDKFQVQASTNFPPPAPFHPQQPLQPTTSHAKYPIGPSDPPNSRPYHDDSTYRQPYPGPLLDQPPMTNYPSATQQYNNTHEITNDPNNPQRGLSTSGFGLQSASSSGPMDRPQYDVRGHQKNTSSLNLRDNSTTQNAYKPEYSREENRGPKKQGVPARIEGNAWGYTNNRSSNDLSDEERMKSRSYQGTGNNPPQYASNNNPLVDPSAETKKESKFRKLFPKKSKY